MAHQGKDEHEIAGDKVAVMQAGQIVGDTEKLVLQLLFVCSDTPDQWSWSPS